jgi:hypothetical protein
MNIAVDHSGHPALLTDLLTGVLTAWAKMSPTPAACSRWPLRVLARWSLRSPYPGAAHRICLGAHQRLGEGLHHRAQQIRARLRDLLLQPVTSILGPAVIAWLLIIESLDGLNENHAVAASPHDAMLTSGNIEHHISGRNHLRTWSTGHT